MLFNFKVNSDSINSPIYPHTSDAGVLYTADGNQIYVLGDLDEFLGCELLDTQGTYPLVVL